MLDTSSTRAVALRNIYSRVFPRMPTWIGCIPHIRFTTTPTAPKSLTEPHTRPSRANAPVMPATAISSVGRSVVQSTLGGSRPSEIAANQVRAPASLSTRSRICSTTTDIGISDIMP